MKIDNANRYNRKSCSWQVRFYHISVMNISDSTAGLALVWLPQIKSYSVPQTVVLVTQDLNVTVRLSFFSAFPAQMCRLVGIVYHLQPDLLKLSLISNGFFIS